MTPLDWTLSVLAAVSAIVSISILLRRNAHRSNFDDREREDCVSDIRAMNTYNSYFMTAIVVFFGFAFGATAGGSGNQLPHSALMMLSVSFLSASAGMFYVPIRKLKSGAAEVTPSSLSAIRSRWVAVIICSQLTVIFCAWGVLNIVIGHIIHDLSRVHPSTLPAIVPG